MEDVRKLRFGLGFRLMQPYCLTRLEVDAPRGGKHVWLPLNRGYKPLGIYEHGQWVQYEAYAHQAWCFARDPRTFKNIWTAMSAANLWLYDGCDTSLVTYWERLHRLLSHKHKVMSDAPTAARFIVPYSE